jgi:TolB-like protein
VQVKNPDTGEVLGTQKRRIARLTVVEALDKLSRTKLVGDLDVEIKVGDLVEPGQQAKPIAILPFVDLNGAVRAGGKKLEEDLITGLTQGGISIVERAFLGKVLTELGLQNTRVFDPDKAQKIGKQLGAYAVLVGTLTPNGYRSDANLRLIKVETGEILFATRQSGPNLGAITEAGSETVIVPSNPSRPLAIVKPAPKAPPVIVNLGWRPLFNGKDLNGWKRRNPQAKGEWRVENGVVVGSGFGRSRRDLYTEDGFWNFNFRCEFMIGTGGDSGIFLRGRHEIQISDDYNVGHTAKGATGALCPFVSPSVFVSRPADQWQTVEATLIGNKVTVILNGTKIHDGIELNQVVNGVLDKNINAPGPILLQGNRGTVRFRNLMIKEIK